MDIMKHLSAILIEEARNCDYVYIVAVSHFENIASKFSNYSYGSKIDENQRFG
ncbi:hypothetical protein [Blautia sp. An249]|uniref:hypothetical protein n=1 Tax=Blautia sp. An249 TaxID=1965603 RepID=UPI0013A6424A|nr:hypothetical protein [Blautia sp. An249]